MRRLRLVVLLVIVAAAAFAATHWPRLRQVETGRSRAYPEIQPRHYGRSPSEVARAVEATLQTLPGWTLRGSGSGEGGYAMQADHRVFRLAPVSEEITITIRSSGRGSRLSVLSRSRITPWDFGQNARNVRELLASLDGRLTPAREKVGESRE